MIATRYFFTHVDRRETVDRIADNIKGGGVYPLYEKEEIAAGAKFATEVIAKITIMVEIKEPKCR